MLNCNSIAATVFSIVWFFPGTEKAQTIPIEHFIYIIQENHSFDSYFGTFPNANGIPTGTALPKSPGGRPRFKPFHLSADHIEKDLVHSWAAAHLAYDNGKMDGFIWSEWPEAAHYYWGGKPVPTPIPGLVHLPQVTGMPVARMGRFRQGRNKSFRLTGLRTTKTTMILM
ncbi:MAG TPA: alkaline phosphatase family protein [Chthoniobacterales bacterium]|jgi:phosphoesterase family protein|nr:alkaline phosphatase family protein [Chthoniobacterales bacterium]